MASRSKAAKKPRKRATVKAVSDNKKEIEEQQRRFVEVYVALNGNATQAYLAIKPNVKDTTAAVEGHKFLRLPKVQRWIEERRAQLRRQFALTSERVLEEHARLAYFDPSKMLDEDGNPLPLHKVDPATRSGLARFQVKTTEVIGEGADRKVIHKTTSFAPFNKPSVLNLVNKILGNYEAPPPPPPPEPGDDEVDWQDTARRMLFGLAKLAKEAAKPAQVKRKKKAAIK